MISGHFTSAKLTVSILLFALATFSCNRTDKKSVKSILNNSSFENEKKLKQKILLGDTLAYFQLRKLYIDKDAPTDFLFWAQFMADKYNFQSAYYDVFFCVQQVNIYYGEYSKETRSYKNNLDPATIEFAKTYLLKMSNKQIIDRTLKFYNRDTVVNAQHSN